MPNTYSQITIHAVFAVKQRENYIQTDWRDSLHKYIAGIITNKGAKALQLVDGKTIFTFYLGCRLLPILLN
jgi:hypothetical protein